MDKINKKETAKASYHTHITLICSDQIKVASFARKHKCKVTIIELYDSSKEQTDVMLTKYGNDYDVLLDDAKSIARDAKSNGIHVARIKVEQLLKGRPLTFVKECDYMEYHVKVEDTNTSEIDGFVMSRNPHEHGTRFYNARIYNEEDFVIVDNSLNNIPNILSTHYELSLYDSNKQHDGWWA